MHGMGYGMLQYSTMVYFVPWYSTAPKYHGKFVPWYFGAVLYHGIYYRVVEYCPKIPWYKFTMVFWGSTVPWYILYHGTVLPQNTMVIFCGIKGQKPLF